MMYCWHKDLKKMDLPLLHWPIYNPQWLTPHQSEIVQDHFPRRICFPLPSNRRPLSCDAGLEVKTEDNRNCHMLCCVRQMCTTIRAQMSAVFTARCYASAVYAMGLCLSVSVTSRSSTKTAERIRLVFGM